MSAPASATPSPAPAAQEPHDDSILYAAFNQDCTCVSVGTRNGYKIYNCDPFGKCYQKAESGMGLVEMLFCTSLVALVGNGDVPTSSPRKLQIINTKRQSTICELTFPSSVLAVRLNRKRLVVVLAAHIYIYDIGNMRLLHTIDGAGFSAAVVALAPSSTQCFLAYPAPRPAAADGGELALFDAGTLAPTRTVVAHRNALVCVSFSQDGRLVATASDRGTVVRVFSAPGGEPLWLFRRGTLSARISCLAFNARATLLAVASDSGTVHVFRLDARTRRPSAPPAGTVPDGGSGQPDSRRSTLAALAAMVVPGVVQDLYQPERDFAYARIKPVARAPARHRASADSPGDSPASQGDTGFSGIGVSSSLRSLGAGAAAALAGGAPLRAICAISSTSPQLMVVTADGYFYQFSIDLVKGGECIPLRQYSLLDVDEGR